MQQPEALAGGAWGSGGVCFVSAMAGRQRHVVGLRCGARTRQQPSPLRPGRALKVFGDMVTAAPMVMPPADLPWMARRSELVQPSCAASTRVQRWSR